MTAVEYLSEQMRLTNIEGLRIKLWDAIEEAKEMEKEQREEDLESGFDTGRLYQGREGDTTLGQLKSKTFKSE